MLHTFTFIVSHGYNCVVGGDPYVANRQLIVGNSIEELCGCGWVRKEFGFAVGKDKVKFVYLFRINKSIYI